MGDQRPIGGALTDAEIDVLHGLGVLPFGAVEARLEEAEARAAGHLWDPLIGPFLHADDVTTLLDDVATVEQLVAMRDQHVVLGLVLAGDDDRVLYPSWQFEGGRLLDGLPEVLNILLDAVDPWTTATWLRTPSAAVGGVSPAKALAGDHEAGRVIRLAQSQAVEWGR